jgi:hypothetical protein
LILVNLVVSLAIYETAAWSHPVIVHDSNSVACKLIRQKVQGRQPSQKLAHDVAELVDQIDLRKIKIDLDGLLCLAETTDQLDEYDIDVRLRFSLLAYTEEFRNSLWPQVLDRLTSQQKKHIEKILREAARLNEEGNG